LEIDKQTKNKAAKKFLEDSSSAGDDKRMAMYKNMRDELFKDDSKQKSEQQQRKYDEMNAKAAALDQAKREKEERERELEKEEMAKQAAANAKKNQGKLNFLDNIKSFDVEDI
jgi:hypothetical protein